MLFTLCNIFILLIFLTNSAFAGPTKYLIRGLDNYSPYDIAVIELEWVENKPFDVVGSIVPQKADLTKPVRVTGINSEKGFLELKVWTEPAQILKFSKKLSKLEVQWATEWEDGFPSGVYFSRPRDAALSEAALTFQVQGCGGFNGSVSMIPTDVFVSQPDLSGITDQLGQLRTWCNSDLEVCKEKSPKLGSVLDEIANSVGEADHPKVSLPAESDIWSSPMIVLDVPTGTEAHIIKALRGTNLFRWVNLTPGGCGGSHRSLFAAAKSLFFAGDKFSEMSFRENILKGLSKFHSQQFGGTALPGDLSNIRISKVNIPPFPIHMKLDLVAASELTRGVKGYWDKLIVHLEPGDTSQNNADELAVVTWISRLRSSKRSPGNDNPPSDDAWYSLSHPEEAEATPTVSISHYLSKNLDGWCYYDEDGYSPAEHVEDKCQPNERF